MKFLFLGLVLWANSGLGQISASVKGEIDQRVKHGLNPSIAIGVMDHGRTEYYVQGWQNTANKAPANTDTVYEIGSITKTFTALLLARQVASKQVKLDDSVHKLWPASWQLIDPNGQTVTLKHLATHTAGLPRLPANLPLFAADPYVNYDRSQLAAALATVEVQPVGKNLRYSNFGFGLLGETLAVQADTSFNQLMAQLIIQPLGLEHTYLTLAAVPPEHLATGYRGQSEAPAWQFKALAGAGSLRSDIKDLLAYGGWLLNPDQTDGHPQLQQALALVIKTQHAGESEIGLGWFIRDGIIWHNGATAGFMSILMIDPSKQRVVAGFTNGNQSVEDLVAHMINPESKLQEHDFPVAIDAKKLPPYTGQFALQDQSKTLGIKLIEDKLFFTAPKQPKLALTYLGDDTFKLGRIKAKLIFVKDATGRINALTLHGWGEPQTYHRQNN